MGYGYLRLEAMEPVEEVGDLAGDSVLRDQKDTSLETMYMNWITAPRAKAHMDLSPLTPQKVKGSFHCKQRSSKITDCISPV